MQLEATSEPRQVPWCGQLSERTESLRKQILSRGLRWDFFQDDDRETVKPTSFFHFTRSPP
jgi:hypothetical protein